MCLPVVAAMMAAIASPALGQSGWSATLFIDPYPSPYLSDWEINPNISTLTVVNSTGAPQTATAVYRVTNAAGRVLASGRSDPQTVPPDDPRVYTSFVDIAGTSSHDAATEDEMVRTGRIPEGVYRACVTIADGNSFVVGEACADFTILYPDPPLLIAPGNGESITAGAPFLQWTPMQVPAEFQIRYILQVAELLPNQLPDEALNGPVPLYVNPDVGTTNLQWPLDAPPLEEGRSYAWRVVALDQNGYAAATNGGASETYVFRYDPGSGPSPGQSTITLSLNNAFDHDDDGEAIGTRSAGADAAGINEICDRWDNPPTSFVLTADSPLGFRRFAGNDAVLFQEDATKKWWIKTTSPNGKRDVLIHGRCDRLTDGTLLGVDWIASRNETLQQRITGILSSPVAQALVPKGPLGGVAGIDHAMIVLSKGNNTVTVPVEFTAGVEFLGGSDPQVNNGLVSQVVPEYEAATGLNVYATLDMNEFALWPFFQLLGFDEKVVSIYGFLGWDASWSIGVSGFGNMGGGTPQGQVDLSTERKFLVLRATLPQRKPQLLPDGLIQSTGFELEISLGDSTGRAWSDTNYSKYQAASGFMQTAGAAKPDVTESLELIPKLIHRIVVNDNLTLEGSVALDFARSRSLTTEAVTRLKYVTGFLSEVPEVETSTDVIISYGATTRLPLGRNERLYLDAVKLDVKFPLATPRSKQEFMVSGEFGVPNREGLGKIGVAFKRTNLAALHQDLADARKARYEASTKLTAAETGECVKGATVSANKDAWCAIDAKVKSLEKQLAEHNAFPDPSKKTTDWEWRVRASLGHMSLGDLLKLIQGTGS